MKKSSLILLGSGGHAKSCINLIESLDNLKIEGILSEKKELDKEILGYPVIGTDEDLINLASESTRAIVALGQIKSAKKRIKLYEIMKSLDMCSEPIISPFASISDHTNIGDATVVMHGALINANVGSNIVKFK